jgi:hypothetical protein
MVQRAPHNRGHRFILRSWRISTRLRILFQLRYSFTKGLSIMGREARAFARKLLHFL